MAATGEATARVLFDDGRVVGYDSQGEREVASRGVTLLQGRNVHGHAVAYELSADGHLWLRDFLGRRAPLQENVKALDEATTPDGYPAARVQLHNGEVWRYAATGGQDVLGRHIRRTRMNPRSGGTTQPGQ